MPIRLKKTLLWIAVFATLSCGGCRPARKSNIDTNTSDEIAVVEDTQGPSLGKAGRALENELLDNSTTNNERVDQDAADEPKPVAGTKHRFLLFPPDGPLLIELEIIVAGRALDGWIDSMLDEAFALADGDENGQVTWDELFESDELERRYLSNSPVIEQGLDAAKEQYDSNNNDLVDRYEFPQILTGNMSTGQSFGLRSSNYYRELNRFASPLFRYLDSNNNGSLESTEIEAAASRLLSRDFDNDEHVALSDLSLADANPNEMRNNGLQPHVAVWIGPRNPWHTIRLALNELYADGDVLSAEHFPLTPELFGKIDNDRNGRFSLRELAILTEIEPHIAIRVELSPEDPSSRIFSGVLLCESLEVAKVTTDQTPTSLKVSLPKSQIDLFARSVPLQTAEKRAEARLAQVDTDKNQYIDPDEYKAADVEWESEFAELDVDENEMIFLDELTSLFPLSQALAGSQVRVRAGHRPDALFSVLDSDGNQRLAPRELDQLAGELKRLDADADGVVTADELPDRLIVGLTQGSDQEARNLLATPPGIAASIDADVPDWFQSMDHNGDGQLSRREFLGKNGQFNALDKDLNGYLSLDESLTGS